MPELVVAYSFSGDGSSSGTHNKYVLSEHLRSLLFVMSRCNPNGKYINLISATSFPDIASIEDGAAKDVVYDLWAKAKIISTRDNPGHQDGALSCIRLALEGAKSLGATYLMHYGSDVLPVDHDATEKYLFEIKHRNADYLSSRWINNGGVNTQVFICRVDSFFEGCKCKLNTRIGALETTLDIIIKRDNLRFCDVPMQYFHIHNPKLIIQKYNELGKNTTTSRLIEKFFLVSGQEKVKFIPFVGNRIISKQNDDSKVPITIIMSSYLRPKRTRRMIDCVLNQKFKNFEFLIVGDGCPVIQEIIESNEIKDSRVRVVNLFPHEGKGGCRCYDWGLSNAIGEFICTVDNDDIIFDNHVGCRLGSIQNTDYDFVYHSSIVMIKKGYGCAAISKRCYGELNHGVVGNCELVYRKNFVLSKNITYRNGNYGYDWDFIQNMVKSGAKYCYYPSTTYVVRHVPGHLSLDEED